MKPKELALRIRSIGIKKGEELADSIIERKLHAIYSMVKHGALVGASIDQAAEIERLHSPDASLHAVQMTIAQMRQELRVDFETNRRTAISEKSKAQKTFEDDIQALVKNAFKKEFIIAKEYQDKGMLPYKIASKEDVIRTINPKATEAEIRRMGTASKGARQVAAAEAGVSIRDNAQHIDPKPG